MRRFEQRTPSWLFPAVALATGAIFLADLQTVLGLAVWVLYLAPVAALTFAWRPDAPLAAAAVNTVLVWIGFYASPPGPMGLDLPRINRILGVVAIWAVAIVARQAIRTRLEAAAGSWLRATHGELVEALQGDLSVEEAGAAAARVLARAIDAPVAAVYAAADGGRLRLAGAYAGAGGAEPAPSFAPGEGLVGQAARDRRVVVVRDLPQGYLRAASGLGAREPRELALAPAVADGACLGVVEVGSFAPFGRSELDLLELASNPVAVALRSAADGARLRELLEETQRQAETLEAQTEELRVTNEELHQQGDALRRSQAELESQQAELEATNAQLDLQARTLEAQRDELALKGEELAARAAEVERASRYKSEFLARMSHELRTPLNSVLILARLLRENARGNLDAEQVTWAETISSAGGDLLALIDDVLDLARVEAGRLELRIERVAPGELLRALDASFRPVAEERKLGFAVDLDPSAPAAVETDARRVQQVLANLLSNALKFTSSGTVGLRARPAGEGGVAFEVTDTGIGIRPEDQAAVFEAFRQLDAGATRRYGGTGLGLSISRDLARLLGGELVLRSAPGAGSTFTLVLPARAPAPAAAPERRGAAARPAPAPAPPADVPRPAPPGGLTAVAPAPRPPPPPRPAPPPAGATSADPSRARRILVVEDDAGFARLLCTVARDAGFACDVAGTAGEAIDAALREPPDAVLLDVGLPDHSGLAVLETLKRHAETRHVPVHVVSAKEDGRRALELGAVGYARKPVSAEELQGILRGLEARLARTVRRILVVDDDPAQGESIRELLADRAVEVTVAATGARAVELLAAGTWDCVVMDLELPDASGFDLLDRMAAEPGVSFPPVVVYTARAITPEEEARLRRTSDAIVIKGARSPERLLDEVTLFLHRVEAELPPERRRLLAAARGRDRAFEGRKLLVVEDDVRSVFAITSVLEGRGATVRIARDGREALEALDREPDVALVLMDVMMPGMDGHEAMRRIRAQPRFARLPILAITARAMRDDQERCLQAGASDYLAKPLDVDRLLSLVRVWLPR